MAQQATIIQDGIDRFQDAFKTIDQRYKRLQRQADRRRRSFEKNAERRARKLRTEFRKNPVVKRVTALQNEATERIEGGIEQLLSVLRIASQSEVSRLERKISQLNRKVRELERA